MVSDVLFDAVEEIKPYLDPPFSYNPLELELIKAACDHMLTVAGMLARAPRTDGETALENEA